MREPASLHAALAGADAAYYLVHSLDRTAFRRRDAQAAHNFADAAAIARVAQIVYLSGLGDAEDDLSEHLLSRREVEQVLAATGVPVTALRASIVVGHGGISWEMTRQLVEHLPVMITPRCLVGVLGLAGAEGRTFDIGGSEVLEYGDMLRRVAAIEGRPLLIVPVPLLSPRLSSLWVSLVTSVDTRTGRALIDSMTTEAVVREHGIRTLIPFEPMDYDEAVLAALGERAKAKR